MKEEQIVSILRTEVEPLEYDAVLKSIGDARFVLILIDLRHESKAANALRDGRLERAIGVIYLPETEFFSHYFNARLPRQFDAVIHIDRTTALVPLDKNPEWDPTEPPESFPSGL